MTVRIDRLNAGEGPRLRAIRLRALGDAPDAFGTTLEEAVARPADAWTKQLLELPTFVAVSDGVDTGLIRCAPDEHQPETAWLISMWVAPDARRSGVGAILVDTIVNWARSHGVNRLLLDVLDHNAPAIRLYASKGFRPNGEASTLPPPRQHMREHRQELVIRD